MMKKYIILSILPFIFGCSSISSMKLFSNNSNNSSNIKNEKSYNQSKEIRFVDYDVKIRKLTDNPDVDLFMESYLNHHKSLNQLALTIENINTKIINLNNENINSLTKDIYEKSKVFNTQSNKSEKMQEIMFKSYLLTNQIIYSLVNINTTTDLNNKLIKSLKETIQKEEILIKVGLEASSLDVDKEELIKLLDRKSELEKEKEIYLDIIKELYPTAFDKIMSENITKYPNINFEKYEIKDEYEQKIVNKIVKYNLLVEDAKKLNKENIDSFYALNTTKTMKNNGLKSSLDIESDYRKFIETNIKSSQNKFEILETKISLYNITGGKI